MDKLPPKIEERMMKNNKHFKRRANKVATLKKQGQHLSAEERVKIK
jgi:hypothetical protein